MRIRYAYLVVTCLCARVALGQVEQTPTRQPVVPAVVAARAMSGDDAALLSSKHEAIVRAAHFYDYDLGKGDWTVNQAVCSEAAGYLIVQMSEGGPGAESFFTAVVPRNGGTIRIIPLLRKGIPSRWKFGEDVQQREFLEKVIPVDGIALGKADADWMQRIGCYAAVEGVQIGSRDDKNFVIVHEEPAGPIREIAFAGFDPSGEPVIWRIRYGSHGKIEEMEATSGEELRSVPNTAMPEPKQVPEAKPPAETEVRAIPHQAMAQPSPASVPNLPRESNLQAVPSTATVQAKPAPASNPPVKAEVRTLPNVGMTQPTPVPVSNPRAKAEVRIVPNVDMTQPKPVPASNPPVKAEARTVPSVRLTQPKPIAHPNPPVKADVAIIPNVGVAEPKRVPPSNAPARTDLRTVPNTAIAQAKPIPASNLPVEAIPGTDMPESKPVPAANPPAKTNRRAVPNTAAPKPKAVPATKPQEESQIR